MIKINNLNKKFGSNEVLKNISMEFVKGKVYGIVGENGAGKTTLFRCIAGLESYEGEIILKLKELNKTVLISSHIFSTLSDTCDEIHLLRKGEQITSVLKEEFENLEQEMKTFTIGNRIEKLELK